MAKLAARTAKEPAAAKRRDLQFSPLKPRRAFEDISAEIKRLIFSGVLKQGDVLPSETTLAAQFGVCRQTVREALLRLKLAGFIVVQQGATGGAIVADTVLHSISDLFLDAFCVKQMTTDHLTQARLDIERIILKNVLEKNDRAAIIRIKEGVREAEEKFNKHLRPFEDQLRFHTLLAEATGNYVYVIMAESLMSVVAHFHSLLRIGMDTIRKAQKTHHRIIDALEKGDGEQAMKELEKDIRQVDRTYRKLRAGAESPRANRQQANNRKYRGVQK